jgi:peptide/nickel transport system ATP-binding protein
MRGSAPTMLDPPDRCPFLERCSKAVNECRTGPKPPLEDVEPGHRIACYNPVAYSCN